MPRPRTRLHAARIRARWTARRLARETPDWMRWLTPWATSLSLHGLGLLVLALFLYVHGGWDRLARPPAPPAHELAAQLRDDVTSLADADRAGDPFARVESDLPPSLSLRPDPAADVINVPALPPTVRLGERLQLEDPAPSRAEGAEGGKGSGKGVAGGGGNGQEGPMSAPFMGRSPEMKAMLLRREGGTAESERAVEQGLDWLARHQRPDGSWSMDPTPQCLGDGCPRRVSAVSDSAATGLGLLPFLGAGHTHTRKGRYQMVLARGLTWLKRHQGKSGQIYVGGQFNAEMYSQAIATMTLCEAYAITKDPSLKGPAQRALNYIVNTQNKFDGGWRYFPGQPGDLSVFGWEMFALRSGSLAGLSVPSSAIRRCRQFLNACAADPSGASYVYQTGRPVTPTMTAVGLLMRQYLGWNRDTPALLQGSATLLAYMQNSGDRDIYLWYYGTMLLHNMHNKNWPLWNGIVRDALITTQVQGAGCDRGSWDPVNPEWDNWTLKCGRHYLTTLSLLTLEVYYRYLPLYRERDGEIAGTEDAALASTGDAEGAEPKPDAAAKVEARPKADRPAK